MTNRHLPILYSLLIAAAFVGVTSVGIAGEKDGGGTLQGEEYKYQQPGKPLYLDPEKMTSQGINDLHTDSDPMIGREHEAAGGGGHRGPAGDVRDGDVKVIEGPVRYERVDD